MNNLKKSFGWGLIIIGSAQFLAIEAITNYQKTNESKFAGRRQIRSIIGTIATYYSAIGNHLYYRPLTFGVKLIGRKKYPWITSKKKKVDAYQIQQYRHIDLRDGQ